MKGPVEHRAHLQIDPGGDSLIEVDSERLALESGVDLHSFVVFAGSRHEEPGGVVPSTHVGDRFVRERMAAPDFVVVVEVRRVAVGKVLARAFPESAHSFVQIGFDPTAGRQLPKQVERPEPLGQIEPALASLSSDRGDHHHAI